jgi:cardiolipin synthase
VTPIVDEIVDLQADVAPVATVSVPVWSSPVGGHNSVKKLFLLSISAARKTLDIQTPYFVMDGSTRWSLEQAIARGVRVRILTESEATDAKAVKYASRAGYDGLLSTGIEIYEYQPTMMHVKAMIVDGVWSVIGSSNLDNRSLELNDENNIGIADRDFAARLTADFESDLAQTKQLVLEQWRRRSPLEKIRERFWSLFGEVF